MLGKLIKHELHTTRRIMIPVNLAIFAVTLAGCIILSTNIFNHSSSAPLAVFLIILYGLSLISLGLVTTIYLMVRFYKNLFTKEGYLMFTLPVTPVQLLHAKLITAFFWSVISTVLSMLSILALSFTAGYHYAEGNTVSPNFFSGSFTYQISGTAMKVTSFEDLFGYTPSALLLLCMIVLLVGCFSSLTMGYFSIVLGQLIEKYKLACSIAFYIVFTIIMQIVNSIAMIVGNIGNILNMSQTSPDDLMTITRNIYSNLFPMTGIISLIFGIIFYILTLVIMKKKVNMD